MCKPSVIADDWVNKGFHISVAGVELALRPGHLPGMVVIRQVFSAASAADVGAAKRRLQDRCLSDPSVRAEWCKMIDRAIQYLRGYRGDLDDLANGRQAELRFLQRALQRYEER